MARPLRDYQIEDGDYVSKRFATLVAHEPRVGKTNIAIRGADNVEAKIVVVVCPAAVKDNWREAILEFREGGWWGIIVSYNKAGKIARVLRGKKYVLVVDESHYCKERSSQRTKNIFGTLCDKHGGLIENATNVFLLTGTPMPNNPTELWPMLRACAPEIIDNGRGRPLSWSAFRDKYCRMMNTPFGAKIAGSKNYKELKQKLEGFVIRRRRSDVFGRDMVEPSNLYVRAKPTEMKELAAIMATEQGRKVAEALQSANPLKALAKQEKHVASLRKLFGLAKVPGVVDIVSDELDADPNAKIVLFAYHHDVIDALKQNLKKYGVEAFDGRTSDARKLRIKKRFQTDPKCRVVVGQLNAMGVGLDFSAANDVMFVEQSWVGDENEQARSRIFNMNSPEPKFTRFVVLVGSVDEQISAACARKLKDSGRLFN
jgi:SNF2 family DNA or RNA helicase